MIGLNSESVGFGAIESVMNNLLTALIIAVAIIVLVVLYFLKVKKMGTKEEKVNRDKFDRKNSTEYVKFENIISCKIGVGQKESFGIVIIPGGRTFVAALDIKGYNFSSASADERKRTMLNSVAFFNAVENPLQFRQTVKAIDLSYNVDIQYKACKELELRLMDLGEEYDETVSLLEEYIDTPQLYEAAEKRVLELQKSINSIKYQLKEANAIYAYMKGIEGSTGKSRRVNQLLFSYTYDPNDYAQELSESEIYEKAAQELSTKAGIYSSALENCGCRVRLLTGNEILDLYRRHCHPGTADDVRIEELFNSSMNALFITSDSVVALERQKRSDEQFRLQMEAYNKERERVENEAKRRHMQLVSEMETASSAYVDKLEQS